MTGQPTKTQFTPRQRASALLLFPLNLIASAVDLVFCFPWLGRFVKWLWNSLLTLLHFPAGMVEYLAWNFGIQPYKKMKVAAVVLSDENNQPLVDSSSMIAALDSTAQLFLEAAKIKLLPAAQIPKALNKDNQPNPHWITVVGPAESQRILDVNCDLGAIWEDLCLVGSRFQWINLRRNFFTAFRRVFGYGAPVTIFIVQGINNKIGCSLGWFTDYVTIKKTNLNVIAHELGHACNLFHKKDDKTNLMHPYSPKDPVLTTWQIAMLRSSRHVTIL